MTILVAETTEIIARFQKRPARYVHIGRVYASVGNAWDVLSCEGIMPEPHILCMLAAVRQKTVGAMKWDSADISHTS